MMKQKHPKYSFVVKHLAKYLIIGKEALFSFIQHLKQSDILKFDFTCASEFRIEVGTFYKLRIHYRTFTQKLIQILAPYVTEVVSTSWANRPMEYQTLFFEALSKNQKQKKLTIHRLKEVDELIILVLQKLQEKAIPIEFCHISKEVFLILPALKYDLLRFCDLEDWPMSFIFLELFKYIFLKSVKKCFLFIP